jgi:hypothetical protein
MACREQGANHVAELGKVPTVVERTFDFSVVVPEDFYLPLLGSA